MRVARRRDIADLTVAAWRERRSDHGRESDAPSFARLKDGLRRDLQDLFNTRRRFLTPPAALGELERSLLVYGLEDFTNEQLNSFTFRQDFADDVERVLRASEPRIQLHEVVVVENADPLDRRLRFRILGAVELGGERQSLSFDSYLDPVEGAIVVGD